MAMGFICDDGIDPGYFPVSRSSSSFTADKPAFSRVPNVPIIESKIRRPTVEGTPAQARLLETVKRSIRDHSGTMLVGRAGSGKTFLAANIASAVQGTKWYTLDAGDADWNVFECYFRSLILGKKDKKGADKGPPAKAVTPSELIADVSGALDKRTKRWPRLIVLDGVHHLYDSDWFKEMFDHLMRSLPAPAHLIITSRSKPPASLWRLRSKQVLNVIDEKLLAISVKESEELFSKNGLSKDDGKLAHHESFGRAGKLMRILELKKSRSPIAAGQ